MKVVAIIPARLESTRLPNKPLLDIDGLPMAIHVLKRTMLCNDVDEVYVATCNQEIIDAVERYGGKGLMTSAEHPTGTDRIVEAIDNIDCDLVVNVQGDEPLIRPEHISASIKPLLEDDELEVTTLYCKKNELNNPNDVKLVKNLKGDVLYFSRADVPSPIRVKHNEILKQCGLYCFRKEFLKKFAAWKQTPLEKIESVELLRALERGYRIMAVEVSESQSVDVLEELEAVRKLMKNDELRKKY
ncbi:3-deoxy-D-manno-octulosonate cytidylyltransferase [Candidatus Peregrinibacteria bacterium RIFOXYB2_FULL_32_7]|nr:MAG: 3-deoxy-D-manno-octulosonate cytidylyltransferase [Candidatus Peregrinibacteria bacterium RIFOXYB2_FULL_32_7]